MRERDAIATTARETDAEGLIPRPSARVRNLQMGTTYSSVRVVLFVILVAAGGMATAATVALFARHWKLGLKLGAVTVLGFTFATVGAAIIGASRARSSFDGGRISTVAKARRLSDAISTELNRVALGLPLGLLLGGGHACWGKRRKG